MKTFAVSLTEVLNLNQLQNTKSITLAVPFSRTWAVKEWFDCLMAIDWGGNDFWAEVSLLIVADGEAVLQELCKYIHLIPDHARYRIFKTNSNPIVEYGDLLSRRLKICSIWNQMWHIAEGEIILGSEDDSLFPPEAYSKLLKILRSNPKNGFVQASIIGRWASDMVPHWKYEPVGNMRGWASGVWAGETIVQIDGGGWYCFAALKEAGNKAEWTCDLTAHVGPDVLMVHSIKKLGYNTLGVWDIWVTHMVTQTSILDKNRPKYLNLASVDCLDQLLLREVQRGRWDTSSRMIPKPFTVEQMQEYNPNQLVRVKVTRNYQGVEGLCTRGKILTVTMARWRQLESRRLAELIPVTHEFDRDETLLDTKEDVVELNLDDLDEEEDETAPASAKYMGPVPPRPRQQATLLEMAQTQEIIEMVKEESSTKEKPTKAGRPKKKG